MKRNIFAELKNDLWVLVMDIIAVNAAYLLALLLRYYVHSEFKSSALPFLSVYMQFAPFYTVICIVVFSLFRLYNGVWRYASLNDMNRIIGASLTTAVLNYLGTTLFFKRLPTSYYIVGAALQYIFISVIRFSYRFVTYKQKSFAESVNPSIPVIIWGENNYSDKVISYLDRSSVFKPVAIVGDSSKGKSIHGLPVLDNVEEALDVYRVRNAVIADPFMPDREREKLRQVCDSRGVYLHDYSWVLLSQFVDLPLTDLTTIIHRPFRVRLGDKTFDSIEEALEKLNGRYTVTAVSGDNIVVDIKEMVVVLSKKDRAGNRKQ